MHDMARELQDITSWRIVRNWSQIAYLHYNAVQKMRAMYLLLEGE